MLMPNWAARGLPMPSRKRLCGQSFGKRLHWVDLFLKSSRRTDNVYKARCNWPQRTRRTWSINIKVTRQIRTLDRN